MEVVDLAAVEQISEWMRRIAAGGGPLSGLVHAAGEQITAPIRALSPQSLDSLMKTNLRSAVMLALELARDRIRVNCVAPAFVQTGMLDRVREMLTAEQFAALEQAHPLGFGTPRDMAHAIAFLLADTGRWITGSTLVVDGGYSAQ